MICDIMAHWYDLWEIWLLLQLISAMQRKWLCIDVYHEQSLWNKMS